jgi:hypothetical protein
MAAPVVGALAAVPPGTYTTASLISFVLANEQGLFYATSLPEAKAKGMSAQWPSISKSNSSKYKPVQWAEAGVHAVRKRSERHGVVRAGAGVTSCVARACVCCL